MFKRLFLIILGFVFFKTTAQSSYQVIPSQNAKPWVFWYWMQGGVSKAGITADLEAMKEVGIGGAYLMPIKGPATPPVYTPAIQQLTPEWWEMVRFSMSEAKRLGLQMGMHVSDGFALAGGPWIRPEQSMQKVVSASEHVSGGKTILQKLPLPPIKENYYEDIAVLAYPRLSEDTLSTLSIKPSITSSLPNISGQQLIKVGNKESFKTDTKAWFQYAFDKPFTCRSIYIRTGGNTYQAHRLVVEVSNDGINFRKATQLEPPRHGWQDTDSDVTHAIPTTTAKYFRFVYDKNGSEPGAEDLDAAKWKPSLKLLELQLFAAPKIHQYESKTGEIWRMSKQSSFEQLPDNLCVPSNKILDITKFVDKNGAIHWNAPKGLWTIVRIGHTSTGHTNATAGGGKGLECDKFSEEAVKIQFGNWFGDAQKQIGPALSKEVLRYFHVDSWECGSQNWSKNFAQEFSKRRGYSVMPYLLVYTGVPVQSRRVSEQVLFDIRQTIVDLVLEKFYGTLRKITTEKGLIFTAESISPTMMSDGLAHYKLVDIPMGEFWLNSPTHDKPNDMLDAISAAHIYGKNIIQAEGFTTVRMAWNEHPAMLKTLQDRNYALGINKLVYHVFTHNPWINKQPGMTLDGVGLYFQRNQTWWKPAKAWVDYATRCQELLQQGKPVADIAVFTGDDLPRRSVLPDRLVGTLTGLLGSEKVAQEQKRLANEGQPMRQMPAGVGNSANMADSDQWVNPLRGYAYDSFSPDALKSAKVINGKVSFADGNSYALLVLPRALKLSPNTNATSEATLQKLLQLIQAGANVVISERPAVSLSKSNAPNLPSLIDQIWGGDFQGVNGFQVKNVGKGKVILSPIIPENLQALGIKRDVEVLESSGKYATDIAWTHRKEAQKEIYFLANQQNTARTLTYHLRMEMPFVQRYNPVTDTWNTLEVKKQNGISSFNISLPPNGSIFIIGSKKALTSNKSIGDLQKIQSLTGTWQVNFEKEKGGPSSAQLFNSLTDWSANTDTLIKYYSGTATYVKSFDWNGNNSSAIWLDLGEVANIASVRLNGKDCGVAWTAPFRVDISKALEKGKNTVEIEVSNTWHNRLIGDNRLPQNQRVTFTTAPFRLDGRPLEKAGLLGPVEILSEK